MYVKGPQPQFGSRYSFPADIFKTDLNPLTQDLYDKVFYPHEHHWSPEENFITMDLISGRRMTTKVEPNTFYIESRVVTTRPLLRRLAKVLPAFVAKKIEAACDRQVESVLHRHRIEYKKEAFADLRTIAEA
jgi:hypothetical protein